MHTSRKYILFALFFVVLGMGLWLFLSFSKGQKPREPDMTGWSDDRKILSLAYRGKLKEMEALLKEGANPNGLENSMGPLHMLLSEGKLEAAKLLVKYGTDVNAAAGGVLTPLGIAVSKEQMEMIDFLLAHGAKWEDAVVNRAVADRDNGLKIVQSLVEKGASVNAHDTDTMQYTPIFWAIAHQKQDVVIYLLSKGASLEAKNGSGLTPLEFAFSLEEDMRQRNYAEPEWIRKNQEIIQHLMNAAPKKGENNGGARNP